MKIVVLMSGLMMGDAERVAVSFSNFLANQGISTFLMNLDNQEASYPVEKTVHYIKNIEKITTSRIKGFNQRRKFLITNLKEIDPDLIFTMSYKVMYYAFYYKYFCNKKVKVVSSEICYPHPSSKIGKTKILNNMSSKLCDGFIFQTERERKTYPKKVQKKGIVIYNPLFLKAKEDETPTQEIILSTESIFDEYLTYFSSLLRKKKWLLEKIMKKLSQKGLLNWMPDKMYLKNLYFVVMHKRLHLKNPQTFNEKLQWLKLYDRKEEYIKLVDKYEVRKYIKEKIGEEYLIPLLGVYDTFEEIDFSKLPKQFVIKCNHDSGGLVVCKDKEDLNIQAAKEKINKSLARNYYYSCREWPYKNVKPKIIIEKYMEDIEQQELIDYKVMCFHGTCKLIFTCNERFSKTGLKVTFFDLDWNKLPFERHYTSAKKEIKKPKNLDKMLELSKKLAKDIPFVRVDWYEVNGKLYFGEVTFYPGSGLEEFTPEEWDFKLGKLLELPIRGNKNE